MNTQESRRPDFEQWAIDALGREGWPDFPECVVERDGQRLEIWNAALDRAESLKHEEKP